MAEEKGITPRVIDILVDVDNTGRDVMRIWEDGWKTLSKHHIGRIATTISSSPIDLASGSVSVYSDCVQQSAILP
jgi:hypothetical protein